MVKIRVILLLKNRELIYKMIKSSSKQFIYDNGLYPIGIEKIKNWELDNKIRGSEIIFFEGNPIAISDIIIDSKEENKNVLNKDNKEKSDESSLYLDNIILDNALRQTAQQKADYSKIKGIIEYLMNPYNIVILLFLGALIWGITSGFKI